MSFHSTLFPLFLALVYVFHWVIRSFYSDKRLILSMNMLLFSFLFYSFFSLPFLFLFVWLGTSDFFLARAMASTLDKRIRQILLLVSIFQAIALLFYFKYATYALSFFGFTAQIPLPLGISFFLFQSLSYMIDVYRKEIPACKSWVEYLLFLSFFPQMVAGPIVPAHTFFPQWEKPLAFREIPMVFAVFLILLGFLKKLVFADQLAPIADAAFSNPLSLSPKFLWIGLLSYSGQIYCDFSGYTDIAQGTALLFGIRLPENFKMPYLASSYSEFWNRWHISLSQWLRQYLYFPLGGNRGGKWKTYRNLILVMAIGGIWHGANLTFLVWGLGHGFFLVAERLLFGNRQGSFFRWFFTQAGVLFLWIFFRSPNLETALWVAQGLFIKNGEIAAPYSWEIQFLKIFGCLVLGHLLGRFYFSENSVLEKKIEGMQSRGNQILLSFGFAFLLIFIVLFAGDSKSFIYFVF